MVPFPATSDLSLADLRLFATAVELSSLTGAARRLGLPKVSATRHLQRLERVLGCRLIQRDARRFVLSADGRVLLPYAARALAAIEEAVDLIRAQDGPLRGTLRVAAPYTYGRKVIGPRLSRFMALHPQLTVTLIPGSRRVDLLADEADIAIRIGEPGSHSLIARLLSRETFVLCASPAYLAAAPPLARIGDLPSHRFLDLRTDPNAVSLKFSRGEGTRDVPVASVLRSNEPDVVLRAARDGVGLAIRPESCAGRFRAAGELVRLLPEWQLPRRDVSALYAPGRGTSPRIRAFLDFVVDDLTSKAAAFAL
jgi:DNA-binding transcriptional LysR family regulator